MSAIEISVVVPIYNAAAYLGETLEALDRQSFRDYEVILVDDGSTDGSTALVDQFCAAHERFRAVHTENGGEHRARLAGIGQARGRYVAFCDSDDLPLPDMLQKLCERAEETGADITVCGFCREEMETGRARTPEMVNFEPRAYAFPELWDVLPMVNPALWNKLFRREIFEHLIPMDHPPRVSPDLMFCSSLYPFVGTMAFVPEVLYRYRIRRNSAIAHVTEADAALARDNLLLVRNHALRHTDSPELRQYFDDIAFIHFGWALLIRQVKGSLRSRAAVRSCRQWLDANFPGYDRAGKGLWWNLSHHMLQMRVLIGRWIFCAHLMGPFLVFYNVVTQNLKIEIKW